MMPSKNQFFQSWIGRWRCVEVDGVTGCNRALAGLLFGLRTRCSELPPNSHTSQLLYSRLPFRKQPSKSRLEHDGGVSKRLPGYFESSFMESNRRLGSWRAGDLVFIFGKAKHIKEVWQSMLWSCFLKVKRPKRMVIMGLTFRYECIDLRHKRTISACHFLPQPSLPGESKNTVPGSRWNFEQSWNNAAWWKEAEWLMDCEAQTKERYTSQADMSLYSNG